MRRWMIAAVLAAAVGTAGIWWSRQHSSADPTRYLTATVQRGNVTRTVAATGTVQPQTVLSLAFGDTSAGSGSGSAGSGSGSTGSGTSGSAGGSGSSGSGSQPVGSGSAVVRSVSTAVGARVAAGALLATLDDGDQQAQLSLARSQLSVARSQLTVARDQLDTANTGGNTTAVAQAENAAAQANNAVAQAENQVAQATAAVAATRLKAPVAGIVTAVNLTAGLPPPTGAAVELRSSTLVVQAAIVEQDVPVLKAGQAAQVTFTALGVTRDAILAGLPTQASSSTGSAVVTFPVTLTVRNPPPGLLPGMSAQVTIVTAQRTNVLSVPTTAIQGTDTDPTVQVLVDGRPQTRPVEIGLSTEQRTEITVGLSPGDTVVTGVVNPTATTAPGGGFGGGFGPGGFGGGGFGGNRGGAGGTGAGRNAGGGTGGN